MGLHLDRYLNGRRSSGGIRHSNTLLEGTKTRGREASRASLSGSFNLFVLRPGGPGLGESFKRERERRTFRLRRTRERARANDTTRERGAQMRS